MRKDVAKTKAKLAANPLYWDRPDTCLCKACGGKGKKVPLYAVMNYGAEFNHCSKCGLHYTWARGRPATAASSLLHAIDIRQGKLF